MSYNQYATEGDDDNDGVDTIVRNANIFLDGESVILPDATYIDDDYPDEISSINSSIHPNSDLAAMDPPASSRHVKIQGNSPQTKSTTTPSLVEEKSRTSKDTRSVPASNNQPAEAASSSFVPLWIKQAPGWLKIVFILSMLLLLGAMILVVVGVFLALKDDDTTNSALTDGNRTLPPSTQTTPAPVLTPTSPPTAPPASQMPSQVNSNLLTFYVTMGEFDGEMEQLSAIPVGIGNSFMVQLGDWNTNITENGCEDMDFDGVKSLYSNSSIPVYFVVGEKEYNDCTDPSSALDEWRNELVGYESEYWDSPPYQVTRSDRNPELFAVELGNTVVLSINIGQVQEDGDDREAERVSNESLRWIATLYEQNRDNPRNFIILSNQGLPGDDEQSVSFFESLLADIPTYELVQFYLIQPGLEGEGNLDVLSQYSGIENLDVISLINQSWPPFRVSIDTSDDAEEPISVGYDKFD